MKIQDFKIVQITIEESNIIGRCVHCDARDFCGPRFNCNATMSQHYINIKKERKLKLQKLFKLNDR